jgi:YD repeat-containing protein
VGEIIYLALYPFQYGIPTLSHPSGDEVDALDNKIRSPLMAPGASRQVRYIRYRLGFPSSNSAHNGSGIYRIYAIGDQTQFRNRDEEKWPLLEYDPENLCYVLTDYSGEKRIFDQQGRMTESRDRQGRSITYQYLSGSDRLEKIIYPGNVYMEFQYDGNGFLSSIRDSSGRQTRIITDAAGHVKEVVFPDDTRREFAYNNRGLMTMDKNGNAVKNYTWHAEWPVLTNVLLPNGGMRTITPAALKYLINPLAENEGTVNPVDFPYTGNHDGMDSQVTFEDGIKGEYRVGRGWKSRTMNNKLKETIYFANKRTNRVPVKVEEGIDATEITDIKYTVDLQVERIRGKYKDTAWVGGSGSNNTPWTKGGYQEFINTASLNISYNDQGLLSKVTGPHTNMSYTYDTNGNLVEAKNINLGKSTKYGYDTDNNPVSVEYADGKINHMVYDTNGLLTEVINNDNTKVTIARNNRGEIQGITDEQNRTVTLERDIMGRITRETSPSGRTVIYQWGGTGCGSCGSGGDVQLTKIN